MKKLFWTVVIIVIFAGCTMDVQAPDQAPIDGNETENNTQVDLNKNVILKMWATTDTGGFTAGFNIKVVIVYADSLSYVMGAFENVDTHIFDDMYNFQLLEPIFEEVIPVDENRVVTQVRIHKEQAIDTSVSVDVTRRAYYKNKTTDLNSPLVLAFDSVGAVTTTTLVF